MTTIDEKKMIQLLINSDDKQALDAFIKKNGIDAVDRDGRTFLLSAVAKNNLSLVYRATINLTGVATIMLAG
ncbi:hypothetical protein [Oligella urethralis]|uniref:hypothetical protein n=1 Tax=Oligella urethralis TaxID=90245 RepID=UPI00035FD269|nr:hypothetical protein [Oligella urethralis]SUA66294.1 Uncharacterised protein [Oligella urethralis]